MKKFFIGQKVKYRGSNKELKKNEMYEIHRIWEDNTVDITNKKTFSPFCPETGKHIKHLKLIYRNVYSHEVCPFIRKFHPLKFKRKCK